MAGYKKQHYVPQAYLSAWCTQGKLWVRNERGDRFLSPECVANKPWCYRIYPLAKHEMVILAGFLRDLPCIQDDLKVRFLALANERGLTPKERKVWFEKRLCEMEAKFFEVYSSLINDFSSLTKFSTIKHVVSYVVLQYYRTLAYGDLVMRQTFDGLTRLQVMKFLSYVRFALACSDADCILQDIVNVRIVVVKGSAGCEFVTGDNPVRCLETNDSYDLFYLPLSPSRALFLERGEGLQMKSGCLMSCEEMGKLNRLLVRQCLNEIYSCSPLKKEFKR